MIIIVIGPASRAGDTSLLHQCVISQFYQLRMHGNQWSSQKNISRFSPDYENDATEVITMSHHTQIGQ